MEAPQSPLPHATSECKWMDYGHQNSCQETLLNFVPYDELLRLFKKKNRGIFGRLCLQGTHSYNKINIVHTDFYILVQRLRQSKLN